MPIAYINGNVYTVDKTLPRTEAFIVSDDGLFQSVGSSDEILELAKGIEVIDLKGQFVMPGMHDAHCHLLMASEEKLYQAKLGTALGPQAIVKELSNHSSSCKHLDSVSNWLIGNYYHYANFPDGKPDRQFLDDAFGDQPVVIREYTTHNIFANTAALKAAGYEEDPVDPWDGYYVRREDGTITGELVEGAGKMMYASLPKMTKEANITALKYGVKMANRFGFTAVQEASANTVYLDAAKALEESGDLTINLDAHVVFYGIGQFSSENVGQLHHALWNAKNYKSKHFNPMMVKCWMDGVPWFPHNTETKLLEDGKVDMKGLLIPPETFKTYLERFELEKRCAKIHCCGVGSARFALDCIEELRKKYPDSKTRHEIAHNMDVTEEDCKRYKDLGVTAEMSPAVWHLADYQPEVNPKSVYPFNNLKKYGALLTIGSDWVFEPETPSIFGGLQAITENKHGWDLTREEVVDMVTINGAIATGREKSEGTIEAGKLANFIVLDRDLITAEDIAHTVVKKTFFEGKEVYDFETDTMKHLQGKPT